MGNISLEEQLELYDSSPAVVYVCKPAGDFAATFISQGISTQLGWEPQEFLKDPGFWISHIHPEDKERVIAGLSAVFEEGHYRHEYRFQHKDGSYHWMSDVLRLDRDASGSPVRMVGYWTDITAARRQAERTLDDSETRYRQLAELSPDGMLVHIDGEIVFANASLARILAVPSPEDFLGTQSNDLIPSEYQARTEQIREIVRKGKVVKSERSEYLRSDGSRVWVERSVAGISWDNTPAVFVLVRDISDHEAAAEALRESDERFRGVVENLPSALSLKDLQGKFQFVNPKFTEWYGGQADDLIGKTFHDIGTKEYVDVITAEDRKVLETGQALVVEQDIPFTDGTMHSTIRTKFPVLGSDGKPVGVGAISTDITERKRAETELQRTVRETELLHQIAVKANEAVTADEAIQVCLDEVCAHIGWPVGHAYMPARDGSGDLETTKLWHIDDPGRYENLRRITEEIRYVYDQSLPSRVMAKVAPQWMISDTTYQHHPRTNAWIEAGLKSGFAFPAMAGKAVVAVLEFFSPQVIEPDQQFLSVAAEVGILIGQVIERQHVEEDRAASQRRLSGIVDIAPEAVISIDAAGQILLFNQGAESIFGHNAADVIGQSINLLMPERYRDKHHQHIEQFLGSPETSRRMNQRMVLSGLHKDGTEFPAEASISKFVLPDEVVLTVLLRDITERTLAEEALLTAKEEAEEANRAKSEFLANMSHELRTPLNAVNGFSELLAEEAFGPLGNEEYLKFAQAIHDSGQHLLKLINDVLDISKIEAGSAELYEETFDMMPVIDSCITMIRKRAADGGVELVVDIAEDTQPQLHADKTRVKQVVLNLLSNAVKFTETGGRVTLKAWHNEGSGLVLQVIDTGVGIAADDIPKALARFQQVEGGLTRKHEGTGLGLPLAKSLIEQHGGSLDLQSQLGVGTTVTMRLPATRIVPRSQQRATAGPQYRKVS